MSDGERTLEVHESGCGHEGCVTHSPEQVLFLELQDAIDRASDQDQMTWLTGHGKRIAAIVPVEQAERGRISPE